MFSEGLQPPLNSSADLLRVQRDYNLGLKLDCIVLDWIFIVFKT